MGPDAAWDSPLGKRLVKIFTGLIPPKPPRFGCVRLSSRTLIGGLKKKMYKCIESFTHFNMWLEIFNSL